MPAIRPRNRLMLQSVGENIATIFTFMTFILIILAPMAMAFMRTKEKRSPRGKSPEKTAGVKGSGTTGQPAHTARKPRDLLFDLLRRIERKDETEVRFTTPKTGTEPAKRKRSAENSLGTEFRAFDSELGEPFRAIGSEPGMQALESGTVTPAGLPRTRALGRLAQLPELQRAIILAELLGPPKALRERDDLHG